MNIFEPPTDDDIVKDVKKMLLKTKMKTKTSMQKLPKFTKEDILNGFSTIRNGLTYIPDNMFIRISKIKIV